MVEAGCRPGAVSGVRCTGGVAGEDVCRCWECHLNPIWPKRGSLLLQFGTWCHDDKVIDSNRVIITPNWDSFINLIQQVAFLWTGNFCTWLHPRHLVGGANVNMLEMWIVVHLGQAPASRKSQGLSSCVSLMPSIAPTDRPSQKLSCTSDGKPEDQPAGAST